MEKQEGRAACLPACRTSVAVRKGFLVDGHVVVDNIVDTRNIQSACGKVGGHQNGATAITELIERPFAIFLLHAAMKGVAGEFL